MCSGVGQLRETDADWISEDAQVRQQLGMEHHQDDGDEDGDDDDEEDEDVDVDKPLPGAKHPDAVWLQPPAELCLAQRWQLCGKVGLPYHQNLHRINITIIDDDSSSSSWSGSPSSSSRSGTPSPSPSSWSGTCRSSGQCCRGPSGTQPACLITSLPSTPFGTENRLADDEDCDCEHEFGDHGDDA